MKSTETTKQPSDVLIIRGLSSDITEIMILEKIEKLDYYPEYVRIIKDRSNGISKGISIVKFKSVDNSRDFLENYSILEVEGSTGWIDFGFEHSSDDWTCKFCRNINFHHRNACFKCSMLKSNVFEYTVNDGRDDISSAPTRFLLIRNLESEITPQKIFDRIFNFEHNLKRVWLLVDRETLKSKEFAFLEFNSIEFATDFINRQLNVGIPLKIESSELIISYGRDLSLLSQSLSGTLTGRITYWDNNYEFSEYPPYVTIVPEAPIKDEGSVLGIKTKRTAVGALPNLTLKAPAKKIQLQLKNWTAKASTVDNLNNEVPCNFIPETDACKLKNKFIDSTFLCCLLCDMKFNTENDLWNHAQNSEDHAEKFEDYWKKSVTDEKESEYYIDRAAERREAFGVNEEELKKCFQEKRSDTGPKLPIPIGDIEEHSTSDDSFGAKLMKKLGWKEGSGLGKDSSGIVEAIKAKTLENSSAGIGATRIISADEIKSKSYNDIVRSSRKKRYNE